MQPTKLFIYVLFILTPVSINTAKIILLFQKAQVIIVDSKQFHDLAIYNHIMVI